MMIETRPFTLARVTAGSAMPVCSHAEPTAWKAIVPRTGTAVTSACAGEPCPEWWDSVAAASDVGADATGIAHTHWHASAAVGTAANTRARLNASGLSSVLTFPSV